MVNNTGTPDWLRYANQNATRNQPISPQLARAFGQVLPELGVTMEVFSGGQPEKGSGLARVGSVRHDHGNAADVFFYKDGKRLDWANPTDRPLFQEIVRRGKDAGLTGFGAGPGYMQQGSMHVGFGRPGVWGAGGSGKNAPQWLVEAFNGGSAPQQQPQTQIAQSAALPSPSDIIAQRSAPETIANQIASRQTPTQPQLAGTPAPALPAPINVGNAPVSPQQPDSPPPGILAALYGGGTSEPKGDGMSGIMQMLMASQSQQQPEPMQMQPMQMPQNQIGLSDIIQQFMSKAIV